VSVIGLDDGRVRERGRRLGKGGVFFYLAREKGGVCVPIPTHSRNEVWAARGAKKPTLILDFWTCFVGLSEFLVQTFANTPPAFQVPNP